MNFRIKWSPKPEDRDFRIGDWVTEKNELWRGYHNGRGEVRFAYRIIDIDRSGNLIIEDIEGRLNPIYVKKVKYGQEGYAFHGE